MKKLLISILIVLLLILSVITIYKGLAFAGLQVPGLVQIQEKNVQLDESIEKATILASSDYEQALKNIDSDMKKLEEEKKNYEDLVTISTGEQVESANQYQKYEIEYLWTIVGNHATSEGVVLKMDLISGASENHYNLNFTVEGNYIGIIDFISAIENDSVLGFKIENFAINPGASTDNLQATFTCKDITITDIKNGSSINPNNSNRTTDSQNTTNTTNSQNTTNTTNTTNTNNTTNSTNTSTNTQNTAYSADNNDDE